MGKMILTIVGLIIAMTGTVMIYDARTISEKRFSSNEINTTARLLKTVGFIIQMIGLLVIYFK